jgi:hypothetical protein
MTASARSNQERESQMAMKLVVTKPSSPAQKATRTTLDTVLLTREKVALWRPPLFQRNLHINDKVRALVSEIKLLGGVLPGVITIGIVDGVTYIVDGQHRIEAWKMTELVEGFADVRTVFCDDLAQLGDEFVKLNSKLVTLRPDDVLRGIEGSCEPLRTIRKKCPFVGYEMIRRGERSSILSMSLALRIWRGSACEIPAATGGMSSAALAMTITPVEAEQLVAFLNICFQSWGRDVEYAKLWGALNLILCAWLYRRTVLSRYSPKTPVLTTDLFGRCLMAVSADKYYADWLVGRNAGDRDRSPAYTRLKDIFAARLATELGLGKRPSLPKPSWNNG